MYRKAITCAEKYVHSTNLYCSTADLILFLFSVSLIRQSRAIYKTSLLSSSLSFEFVHVILYMEPVLIEMYDYKVGLTRSSMVGTFHYD